MVSGLRVITAGGLAQGIRVLGYCILILGLGVPVYWSSGVHRVSSICHRFVRHLVYVFEGWWDSLSWLRPVWVDGVVKRDGGALFRLAEVSWIWWVFRQRFKWFRFTGGPCYFLLHWWLGAVLFWFYVVVFLRWFCIEALVCGPFVGPLVFYFL